MTREAPAEEEDVLGHLLSIEAQAQDLLRDAQETADRRIMEAEQAGRSQYEEQYREAAARLEAEYEQSLAALKASYQKEMERYREGLQAAAVDQERFRRVMDRLLEGEGYDA
ncbi:MAG: hypothetical protein LBD37_06190 [Treponema sp.]|nr:hypothetical protein [Treponema sp.]